MSFEDLQTPILRLIALDIPLRNLGRFSRINKKTHTACDDYNFRIYYIRAHVEEFTAQIFACSLAPPRVYTAWIAAALHQESTWQPANDTDGCPALYGAVLRSHVEATRLLLRDIRVDPGYEGSLYFIHACSFENTEIVSFFLNDSRVNPCAQNNEPLKTAIECGNVEVMRLLLNEPTGRVRRLLDGKYGTLIDVAGRSGNWDIIPLLLKEKSK